MLLTKRIVKMLWSHEQLLLYGCVLFSSTLLQSIFFDLNWNSRRWENFDRRISTHIVLVALALLVDLYTHEA